MSEPKLSLTDHLQAVASALEIDIKQLRAVGATDEATEKLIVDLRESAALLLDLDKLLDLILEDMAATTNRDLAADGAVGDEEGKVWRAIEGLANIAATKEPEVPEVES